MKAYLKNHPFAVETWFKTSLVLTYALPKEQLKGLIPESLELDTFKDKWAFIAVALVDTKGLRPKGLPAIMGNDFVLAGFRVFVKYHTLKGKRLRGLYILKSETNKAKMAFYGNIFTHYNYTNTDISFKETKDLIKVKSIQSEINISVDHTATFITLPPNSPFKNWKEARRFAGPLPFTFTFNKKTKKVLIIEGVRQNWKPQPVEVLNETIGFVQKHPNLKKAVLANTFIVKNIPYYWKKGKLESWKQNEEHFRAQ